MIYRTNIVNMIILSKSLHKFNALPNKMPTAYFIDLQKTIVKLIGKQETQNNKAILVNKSKAGNIALPELKPSYKAIVIKLAWHWNKTRHID